VRLWTVQPVLVQETLATAGHLLVDPLRVADGWIHPQYAWLAGQLRSRIAGSHGRLPWWAYCERPDLRGLRHTRPAGSREVLIEFEPPTRAFVTFPCWAWHEVFTGAYLARNGVDARAWRTRLRAAGVRPDEDLPEPFQTELEASWQRLFLPDLPARPWRRGAIPAGREAVVEVLEHTWVRRVTEFVGTGRWGS
jgi:hypothetical protein